MLTHEPLIKISHAKIRCYQRKQKRKIKSGDIHTYTVTQHMIILKQDQPFHCDDEVTVIKSEDYFKMDDRLRKQKKEYNEFLEKMYEQEAEINKLKKVVESFEKRDVDSKLKKLKESEIQLKQLKYDYENKVKELVKVKKELESKNKVIEELEDKGFIRRIMSRFKDHDEE
ncbi:MAG: hypothetical protein QME14_07170 [Methanobacteriaceae archaeon]|nr:hypothetical protein [Methanobacteriaceae archaeon]